MPHTWQVRPSGAAMAGVLLWCFLCFSSDASLSPFSAASTPFLMEFLHCMQSWARSYHVERAMLALLMLLCRVSLYCSCYHPCLRVPLGSLSYIMSLGSLPSGILAICPTQCSGPDIIMVETAGIPAQERILVLRTLSCQVIFMRKHRW